MWQSVLRDMKMAKSPKHNLTFNQQKALKELKADEEIDTFTTKGLVWCESRLKNYSTFVNVSKNWTKCKCHLMSSTFTPKFPSKKQLTSLQGYSNLTQASNKEDYRSMT